MCRLAERQMYSERLANGISKAHFGRLLVTRAH